jgi:hypothetical protein
MKMSNGAPFFICAMSFPDDPNTVLIVLPVSFENSCDNSLSAFCIDDAAAIVIWASSETAQQSIISITFFSIVPPFLLTN